MAQKQIFWGHILRSPQAPRSRREAAGKPPGASLEQFQDDELQLPIIPENITNNKICLIQKLLDYYMRTSKSV